MGKALILFLTVLTALNAICHARTRKSYFEIHNHTPYSASLSVHKVDNYDWQGSNRPDHNLRGRKMPAITWLREQEDLNYYAKSRMFNLVLTFENGKELELRIDQPKTMDIVRGVDMLNVISTKSGNTLKVDIYALHAQSYFEINNRTPKSAILLGRPLDHLDWNDKHTIPYKLNTRTLSENSYIREEQELNLGDSSHMFTLGVEFENGKKLALRIDQGLALDSNVQGEIGEGGGGTKRAIKDIIALMDRSMHHGGKAQLYVSGNIDDYIVSYNAGSRTLKVYIDAA